MTRLSTGRLRLNGLADHHKQLTRWPRLCQPVSGFLQTSSASSASYNVESKLIRLDVTAVAASGHRSFTPTRRTPLEWRLGSQRASHARFIPQSWRYLATSKHPTARRELLEHESTGVKLLPRFGWWCQLSGVQERRLESCSVSRCRRD